MGSTVGDQLEQVMISFREMNLWQKLLIRLFPGRRRKYEKELRETIEYLMRHPEAPCVIDGTVIPDGFGGKPLN